MAKMEYENWPDSILEAQILGTIKKLDAEQNQDYKVGLAGYLARLLNEREKRRLKRS